MSPFSLLAPPYRAYLPLSVTEDFPTSLRVLRGAALIWSMKSGHATAYLEKAVERPGGLPLMVILPPSRMLSRLRSDLFEIIEEARPCAVLPYHPHPPPEEMTTLLRSEPDCLPGEFLDFLVWRGLWLDQETRRLIRRTVELSAEVTTLTALSRGVYLSRRALGRRFKRRGLPVPSHWLQFARLLRATLRLQGSEVSLFQIASELGYPDGFTLSNQMERLVGVRPSTARARLGWEWFAEAWLHQEQSKGGLTLTLRGGPRTGSEVAPSRGEAPDQNSACRTCGARRGVA